MKNKACPPVFHTFEKAVQTHPLAPCSRLLAGGTRAAGTRKKNEQKRRRWRRARACQSGTSRAGRGAIQALFTGVWPLQVVGLLEDGPRARSQRRAAAPRATWAASGTAGVRREAGLGRRRDSWPVLRPSRTFKRRQPAARPRILHTRRHDRDERARCRALVRTACARRPWRQQVHQTDLKACRRRAVVARARDSCRGAECSGEPEATWVTKW